MNDTKYIAVYQNRWSPASINFVGTSVASIVEEIRNEGNYLTDYTFYKIDGSLLTPKKLGYTLEE